MKISTYMIILYECVLFQDAHKRYFETLYGIFRGHDFRNNAHERYYTKIQYLFCYRLVRKDI